MVDLSVYQRQRSLSDLMNVNQDRAFAQQIQQVQLKKAQELDVDKIGEQAILKMRQGLPVSGEEQAAAEIVNAKSSGIVQTPYGSIDKPSLLEKLGQPNAGYEPPMTGFENQQPSYGNQTPQLPPVFRQTQEQNTLPQHSGENMGLNLPIKGNKPVSDLYAATMRGQEKASEKFLEEKPARLKEATESAMGARQVIQSFKDLKELNKNSYSGSLVGKTKAFISQNISDLSGQPFTKKAANTEFMINKVNEMIIPTMKTLGANPTDRDVSIMQSAKGGLNLDPQTRNKMYDDAASAAQRVLGIAKLNEVFLNRNEQLPVSAIERLYDMPDFQQDPQGFIDNMIMEINNGSR